MAERNNGEGRRDQHRAKLSQRELKGKRKNPVFPGEEASEKQCVLCCSRYNLFTVDAKSVDCESGCKTQTHRRGSVIQVNQELSSERRFVSLGFPLPFPVLNVLLIEYSSSKQHVTFVSLIRDPVTNLRYCS